jgi:colanic acid biosynthesis glycosyl transferase WcaI
MLGVVNDDRLERELRDASIGLVTQHHAGAEFNIPSKLMNFMAYGLPILAAVNSGGEVAKIVNESGSGWIVDSSRPEDFPARVAELASDPDELARRGRAASAYAAERFSTHGFSALFEAALVEAVERAGKRVRR